MENKDILEILKDKRFLWAVTGILFLTILFMSSSIRLSNWDLLTDSTTGGKIPLALDPYYFLRIAETLVENNGTLPAVDAMRGNAIWHPEIMPRVIVSMWKVSNVFGDYSLRTVDIASPVFFYVIGLILFFFLCYFLTKSKVVSLLSSGLLAFSPAYLYRTMAGFADHESIGMVAVFACLLFYIFALENFGKNWKRTVLYGLGLGFFSSLVLACWSGAITFILMVIPASFLVFWLLKARNKIKAIVFYITWIISSVFFPGIFNVDLIGWMVNRLSASSGLLASAVLGFMLIYLAIEELMKRDMLKITEKKKLPFSIGAAAILGWIGLIAIGKSIFSVIKEVWYAVLFPFGTGRVGLTVAENAQPYLTDWIGQNGLIVFWLFVLGIFLIGFEFGKDIKDKKHFIFFGLSWILMISAMLFSRISSESILNGETFISQVIYLIGVATFAIYFVWLNMNEMFSKNKVNSLLILLMSIMFVVVLNGRSAVRTFFLITPFVLLSAGYFVMKIFEYALKNKEEISKIILWGLFLFALGGVLFSINTYKENIANQAQYTRPSADNQWQEAMSWVRNNTDEGDKFAHWWDYGYWVQTLGERQTIADGGHFQGFFDGNERIGRYLLTTDKPESAYSLMKTQNISHLLIDQTDLGKYSAYSKIGSDDDWDRFSIIPVGVLDGKSTQESADGTTFVYQFGGVVDEDIYYENIFLPGPVYDKYGRPSYKSFIGGVILKIDSNNSVRQPEAIYIYNGMQYSIPLRYLYVNGEMRDFKSGLNGTLRLIPALEQSGQGMSTNPIGAGIYLSPRTGKTLFSKLYLMDDPFDEYEDISLVHSEDDPVVKSMKAQGAAVNEFVYYQGFRGPIKIWDVDYPAETQTYEEFLTRQTGYGDMDWAFE